MIGHALSRPLHLTNPAPLEAAARFCTDHVHTAAVSLGRCSTAGAGFADDPDGDGAGVGSGPLRPGRPRVGRVHRPAPPFSRPALLTRTVTGRDAGSHVSSLETVSTEDVAALDTGQPATVGSLVRGEDSGTTAGLGAQDSSCLEHQLLGTEPLVPVVVVVAHQLEVPGLLNQAVLAVDGTGEGVAEIEVQHKLTFVQPGS